MSADEIRRIAEDQTFKAFVSDGPACIIVTSKVKVTLLAYAAMVERCEAEIALTDKTHYTYNRLNYILRGDAGKEEQNDDQRHS